VFAITNSAGGSVNTAVGDLIEADGAGRWIQLTPPSDCGWLAFVQDENLYYGYMGTAWAQTPPAASDTVAGILEIADQSEMEAATDVLKAVVPGRLRFNPGNVKVWASVAVSGGVPTLSASNNVSGITDSGTGVLTVTIDTDFANTDYAIVGMASRSGAGLNIIVETLGSRAAGSFVVESENTGGGGNADPDRYSIMAVGDFA
jgi:hypothetical protein